MIFQLIVIFICVVQAKGTAYPSYTSGLLEKGGLSEEEEFIVKWSAASMYSGGADTVRAVYSYSQKQLADRLPRRPSPPSTHSTSP
jgi:hypothetical protein